MATKARKKSAKKASRKPAKKAARKSVKKAARTGAGTDLHAKGGGAGPAAGVTHQGWVGGLFAAIGLDQVPVDKRLQLATESISEVRLETDSPIDDLILLTTAPGRLFVQAKTNVSLAAAKSSEMVKTIDQFVRQWRLCSEGKSVRGWDYPLDKDRDRFVIAVGPETPDRVGVHLAKALLRRREGASPHTTPKGQREALADFTALIKASWKRIYGTAPKKQDIDAILDLAVFLKFDFDGADFGWGELLLKDNIVQKKTARAAFTTLAHECEERMKRRTSFTIREIRRVLEQNGVALLAPEDYRKEVDALKKKSLQLRDSLSASTRLDVGDGHPIPIPRKVLGIAKAAAKGGPVLLVGQPGAGKTGVVTELAGQLEADEGEVLLLKVSASGLTGLRSDLALSHSLRDVLENWPGVAPAYLLIDGLDEARGGPADTEYRSLIADYWDSRTAAGSWSPPCAHSTCAPASNINPSSRELHRTPNFRPAVPIWPTSARSRSALGLTRNSICSWPKRQSCAKLSKPLAQNFVKSPWCPSIPSSLRRSFTSAPLIRSWAQSVTRRTCWKSIGIIASLHWALKEKPASRPSSKQW